MYGDQGKIDKDFDAILLCSFLLSFQYQHKGKQHSLDSTHSREGFAEMGFRAGQILLSRYLSIRPLYQCVCNLTVWLVIDGRKTKHTRRLSRISWHNRFHFFSSLIFSDGTECLVRLLFLSDLLWPVRILSTIYALLCCSAPRKVNSLAFFLRHLVYACWLIDELRFISRPCSLRNQSSWFVPGRISTPSQNLIPTIFEDTHQQISPMKWLWWIKRYCYESDLKNSLILLFSLRKKFHWWSRCRANGDMSVV